jgi:predicted O-methyltransferase YrrM
LWRGSHHRISRFHSEKGVVVDSGGLLYAPAALMTAALKVTTGYRPKVPMISYRGRRAIAAHLNGASVAVEFGSGLSTPWLAARCGHLLSIEDDPAWHTRVQALLADGGFTNVRHELRESGTYADTGDLADGSVDFALVDSSMRAECVRRVLPKLRPGGMIYLDNSDKDMTTADGDLRQAESALRDGVAERGGSLRIFTDFSPTNFFVEEGMLGIL